MSKKYDVAIVGATGAVGDALLSILETRNFPVARLYLLASAESAGRKIRFKEQSISVQALNGFDFTQVQIALFSAGASISALHVPRAVEAGCTVVDNTSQFRYDKDIPLIVPEVNLHVLEAYQEPGIIANPNCSTIQMVVALKPIYDAVGIKRINVCTYQAVSGSGKRAIDELTKQSRELLNGQPIQSQVYPKQIAFNVLPHIDEFQENGYTKEEMKMVWETRKIFEDDSIQVNPTAVRVPVFYGHAEAIHIETDEKITALEAKKLLSTAVGVEVLDGKGCYPTSVTDAAGRDSVYVGRIREDISTDCGLNMWVVSDNIRKGAALNSIQVAEYLLNFYEKCL